MPPKKLLTPYQFKQGLEFKQDLPPFLKSLYGSLGVQTPDRFQPDEHEECPVNDDTRLPVTQSTITPAQTPKSGSAHPRFSKGLAVPTTRHNEDHSDQDEVDGLADLTTTTQDNRPQVVVLDSTQHLSLQEAQRLVSLTAEVPPGESRPTHPGATTGNSTSKITFRSKAQREGEPPAVTKRRNDSTGLDPAAKPSAEASQPKKAKTNRRTKPNRKVPTLSFAAEDEI
ncbi:hypothetical protein IWQ62_006617 [Dispira parvispora]|uniref:DUF4604 domain-containing protein n=1 Tax=Dispira parvispora TaxID=1520584 RepID=A0A9W8AGB2_9FUNG|nr:hypothetical protein IWQ62_006617 [Dispira parvispora]